MLIDPDKLSTPDTYFIMTQTVMPRPIAWVLSENEGGDYNLAPFSYFNAVCSDPPLIMVSIGLQPDGSKKDTLINITDRPRLVVHIASCDQLPDLNLSSATLPYGQSEVTAAGIELVDQEGFALPRIEQCKTAFMCEVDQIQDIGNNHQSLVLARVNGIFIDDDCTEITDKGRLKVNADRVQPLARLGASEYASFGEVMSLKRPD